MKGSWQNQRWQCIEKPVAGAIAQGDDTAQAAARHVLAQKLGLGPLVARLLAQRGMCEPEKARSFLQPKLTDLHDPLLLPGMEVAAARLAQAVADKQPVVVYGDYDVDGITASAILYHTLTMAGAQVRTYVPHRIEEGYGLNPQAIETICNELTPGERGGVIISVDCGVTACEAAAVARAKNVDLIITDHHQYDEAAMPEALAIVHPSLPDSQYPYADLCGAGVALKVAWAFARLHCKTEKLPEAWRALMLDMLSLASLGTVADVVPLLGENRVITTYGLGRIKNTNIAGLNALIDISDLRQDKIDATHVGFILGPQLNACGRMGHASKAVQLLTTAQGEEAQKLALFLRQENQKRKETERAITQEAFEMIRQAGYDSSSHRAIVVAHETWHQGVVGIVASRIVDAFRRPAIVMAIDEQGQAHGSARSVDKISIHEGLTACANHLERFGGHHMAAGLHTSAAKLASFRDDLVAWVNDRLEEDDLLEVVQADLLCTMDELDMACAQQLQQLAPFGRGNPQPLFAICDLRITQPPRLMGKQGQHLALVVSDGRQALRAVGFSMGHLFEALAVGMQVDVVCDVKINHWQNRTNVELILKGIRPAQGPDAWEPAEVKTDEALAEETAEAK